MNIIGIDLGRFSIKIAVVEPTSKGFTLLNTQVFELSQDHNRDHRLDTIEILRRVSDTFDPTRTKYVVGLEADKVSLRKKVFPFKERHKIIKSLPFELEDEIPIAHEDLLYDGKIIKFVGSTSEVLAMATQRSTVTELVSLLHDGHIEPAILSLSNAALSNLFEGTFDFPPTEDSSAQPIPDAKLATCLLDIGFQNTKLSIFKGNRLIEIRLIDWGSIDLVNEVSKKYSLAFSDAIKEVQKKGFVLLSDDGATKDQIAFSNLFKERLNDFGMKLKYTFIEIESSHQIEIGQIDFIGGISFFRNLAPYLTQRINLKVNRLKSVPLQNWIPDQINLETNPNQDFQCALAISLAIEGIKRPVNPPINFLNGDLAKQSKAFKHALAKWGHAIQIATALVVAFFVWAIFRDDFAASMLVKAEETLKKVAQSTPEIRGKKASLTSVNKYISDQLKMRKNIEAAEDVKGINSVIDVISSISNSLPKKSELSMNITRLSVDNERVVFEGEVDRALLIQKVRDSLKVLSMDGKISEAKTGKVITPGWNGFSFNFRVQRKIGGS